MTETTAGVGHNNPPADPFLASLAEDYAGLLDEMEALELELRSLPAEASSDDDVTKLGAYVIRRRQLARRVEDARVLKKQPYLDRGRVIDGWFNPIIKTLTDRAASVERRSVVYLETKRRAEEIARQRAAAEARETAAKAEAEAEAARAREAEAKGRLGNAEAALRAGSDDTQAFVEARRGVNVATEQTNAAVAAAADAAAQAARGADAIAAPVLMKTSGAAGSTALKDEIAHRVTNWGLVIQSLGPLGPWLNEDIINAALARACKAKGGPPTVPGVEFAQVAKVRTTASRAKGG